MPRPPPQNPPNQAFASTYSESSPAYSVEDTARHSPVHKRPLPLIEPKASKLSFAQQLYASAAKPSGPYTPPSITVPSITGSSSRAPLVSLTSNGISSRPHAASVSSYRPQSYHTPHDTHRAPHRTQSYQPASNSHHQPSAHHRASTISTGITYGHSNTSNFNVPLRPLHTGGSSSQSQIPDTTPSLQTIATLPPHVQQYHTNTSMPLAVPIPSYPAVPPPATSPIFPASNATHPFQHPLPATAMSPPHIPTQIQPQIQQQQVQQQILQQHQIPTATPPKPQAQQQSSQIGQAVGRFALGVAGGALSAALGIPNKNGGISGALGAALENGAFNDGGDIFGALVGGVSGTDYTGSDPSASQGGGLDSSFLAGLDPSLLQGGTGLDSSFLQAIQGQSSDTGYQSLINGLTQQQQPTSQPDPNFQALMHLQQQYAAQNQQMLSQMAAGGHHAAPSTATGLHHGAQMQHHHQTSGSHHAASNPPHGQNLHGAQHQNNAGQSMQNALDQQTQAILQQLQQQQAAQDQLIQQQMNQMMGGFNQQQTQFQFGGGGDYDGYAALAAAQSQAASLDFAIGIQQSGIF
ncbi:hypothetical protein H0H81_004287 [Sphagnurus paluster]|uniref:Uncharacterized protein n=1 Tax=Sphagnurus paluster TaxID=117069 RepID=A0A9P7GTR2_9AGAR|nr:hypothetical protein H0H81_004287 [Sphagnurus paluster]